jgi:hypothetical protein
MIIGKRYRTQKITGLLVLQVLEESHRGSYNGSYPDDLPPPNWTDMIRVWRDATVEDLTDEMFNLNRGE